MSISGALNAALTGLGATARGAAVVSDNVANAATEGYGPRRLELGARATGSTGAGVEILAVRRDTDARLVGDRRLAAAAEGLAGTTATFWDRIEATLGLPGAGDSLAGRIDAFDAALLRAEARPDLGTALAGVLDTATALAGGIARAASQVQALRQETDAAIARDAAALDAGLARVETLNRQILRQQAGGGDVLALIDQRQQVVDSLSAIVPLMEHARPNGQIALYTAGGVALLEGRAARIGFDATAVVTPDMTIGAGLSGLTVNGRPVSMAPGGGFDGGRIAAAAAIRDTLAPDAQATLDGLSRGLAARFADPAADPTLAPGAAGLFEIGAPATAPGAAQRLGINALADPERGGALWRLRDGLGAAAPGPEGDAGGLRALRAALAAPGAAAPAGWDLGTGGVADRAAALLTVAGTARQTSGAEAAFANTRADILREAEAARGVDTDAELQRLLQIEQAYAANARVVQVASQMLARLMEI